MTYGLTYVQVHKHTHQAFYYIKRSWLKLTLASPSHTHKCVCMWERLASVIYREHGLYASKCLIWRCDDTSRNTNCDFRNVSHIFPCSLRKTIQLIKRSIERKGGKKRTMHVKYFQRLNMIISQKYLYREERNSLNNFSL